MAVDDERVDTAEGGDATGQSVTPWTHRLAPVREFVATENASALVLLLATVTALVWANSPWSASYESFWHTEVSLQFGNAELSLDLRHWINDGLMAFFFFVVGLEIRREFDMGELRERRRVATPVLAAIGGMLAPALIYLAINAGEPTARGWGIAMGTDTAFALGILTLVGGATPRVRTFLLTLVIVDDIVALLVIALAYTSDLSWGALAVAVGPVRRRPRHAGGRGPPRRALLHGRARHVDRHAGLGRPRHDRRGRGGPAGHRLPAVARVADTGRRPVAPLPRGTDAAVRPHRQPFAGAVGVAERAPAEPVPPLDQLRRGAALRPRQRRA